MYPSIYLSITPSIYVCLSIYHLPISLSLYPSFIYLPTYPLSYTLCIYVPTRLPAMCAAHLYMYIPIAVYYRNYHITLKMVKTKSLVL